MSALKKFFLFCSGIDQDILQKCPSDENKYIGIGATVFFTGVLAFISSGYALYTVFDSWIAALLFGAVWGLMIFNLDRYIVSSMKSYGSWWRDLIVAFPRLAMAILLALVISKPLELKIFEKEIDAELVVMQQEVFKEQEDKIRMRYKPQLDSLQSSIDALKSEIVQKETNRDQLALMALQEADGTGGSGKKNLGPIYRAKKKEADKAQADLDSTLANYLPLISKKEDRIQEINTAIQTDIATIDRSNFGGMAGRMEALHRLGEDSSAIYLASIFIMLLFISIETAPIFVKLISYRSPYDYLIHEHVYKMANLEKTSLLSNEIKNKVSVDTEVKRYQANAKIEAEKARVDALLKKRIEELKSNPDLYWDGI